MKKSLILVGMLSIGYAYAQEGNVGINVESPKATLHIQPSADNLTKTTNEGIIAPKLTKARIAGIADANLVEGTLVYATDNVYTGANTKVAKITEKGYYYYNGTEWVKVQHTDTNTELWAQRVTGGVTETYLKPSNEQNDRITYAPNRGLDINTHFIPSASQDKVGFRNTTLSSRNNEVNEIRNLRGIANNTHINANTTVGGFINIENNVTAKENSKNNNIMGAYDNIVIEKGAIFTGGSVWGSRANIGIAEGVTLPGDYRLYGNQSNVSIAGKYDKLDVWGTRNSVNLTAPEASVRNVWGTETVLYGNDNTTVDNVYGFRFWNANADKVKVNNSMRGLHIDPIINGQVSNYGIFVGSVGNDVATDNYAIYTNKGTNSFGDKVIINKGGDGEEILRLNTQRPWVFKQVGEADKSNLALQSTVGNKYLLIQDKDANNVATFYTTGTESIAGTRVNLVEGGGRVGIGVTSSDTTHTLHVKADANPLKLEGLQEGTGSTLVVDANGVVKKGTATSASAEASKVASTNDIQCNEANRGTMNFGRVNINGKATDAIGFCMKNGDNEFRWYYIYGGASHTVGTNATFGAGLQ